MAGFGTAAICRASQISGFLSKRLHDGSILLLSAVGLIQLFLLYTLGLFGGEPVVQSSLEEVVALSVFFVLMISMIEGVLAALRKERTHPGIFAAWVVAGISLLTIALPILTLIVLIVISPRPAGGVDSNDLGPKLRKLSSGAE